MNERTNKSFLEDRKGKKPFEKIDVLAYAVLFIVIALSFVFLIILPNGKTQNGFKITVGEKLVLSYAYGGSAQVEPDWNGFVEIDADNDTITVFLNAEKTEYNVIKFDDGVKSVKMIDSTCSLSKDCVHSLEIKNSGTIYCAPHDLKITPLVSGPSSPVVG